MQGKPHRTASHGRAAVAALILLALSYGNICHVQAGGRDVDLGQSLTAMSELEDWVAQTFWTFTPVNPDAADNNTVVELSAQKFDMVLFTGVSDTPAGDFQLFAGSSDPKSDDFFFGYRVLVGGPWELAPDTEHKLTWHYKAETETIDFWVGDEIYVADFVGPGFGACNDPFYAEFLFPGRCPPSNTAPHALSKIQLNNCCETLVNGDPIDPSNPVPPGATDTYDNTRIGLLDPASVSDTTAPNPLLSTEAPGLNLPIEPDEAVGQGLTKDWGAINNVFGTWNTASGKLASSSILEALRMQTTFAQIGPQVTIFLLPGNDNMLGTRDDIAYRGDVNGDRALNNLDITPLVAALAIGGDVTAANQEALAEQLNSETASFAGADMNRSNSVDNLDITPFLEALIAVADAPELEVSPPPPTQAAPEPAVALILALGGMWPLIRRSRR